MTVKTAPMAFTISLAVFVAVFLWFANKADRPIQPLAQETVFERVLRTKTLRCGYVSIPLISLKDPKTGQFSGVSYDIVNAMGRFLGLKIEWAVETNFSTMLEELSLGRVDAICHGDFPKEATVARAEFTDPFHYLGFAAYSRADDMRFDGSLKSLNEPNVRVAVLDGEVSNVIAKTQLPQAQRVSVPQNASISEMILQVTTKKADIAIVPVPVAKLFLKYNPDSIRSAYGEKPIRVYPISLVVSHGETNLLNLLNKAVREVTLNGEADAALHRYFSPDDMFYPVASPYAQLSAEQ